MDSQEDFRRRLDIVSRAGQDPSGWHPDEDTLLDYRGERLAADAHERVQAHLVACHECLGVFQDLVGFFAPPPADEAPAPAAEVRRERKALRARLGRATRAAGPTGFLRFGTWFSLRVVLAVAAGLLLIVLPLGTWGLWLRRENQQLAGRLQAEQQLRTGRADQWAAERRRLEARVGEVEEKYQAQLAELRRPQLNVPLYDVLSRELIERSGPAGSAIPVHVPAGVRTFGLILNGEGRPYYPAYAIEVQNAKGEQVWHSDGLPRGRDGNFIVLLDRSFLSDGNYRLIVHGRAGGRTHRLAEYPIDLRVTR
jgi:hypothetical protein